MSPASAILHLAIQHFPIAVTRVAQPGLRNWPVAIAPAHSERALLVAASAEAEAEGVWAGMPLHRAVRRCPRLKLLLPDPVLLKRATLAVERLAAGYTPVWEPAGGGRLFLDLTGSHRLLGSGRDAAARLDRELRQRLCLPGQVGVAGNKLVSRIAAGYLRRPGVCDVFPGSEEAFIAPLPANTLPGIGQQRQRTLLDELNLRTVMEVARLSIPQLALIVGPFAPLLHQRAHGIDFSPVRPVRRRPRIAADTLLLQASNADTALQAELCRLVEECGLKLRQRGTGCRQLRLTLDYCDGVRRRQHHLLPQPERNDLPLLTAADLLLQRCHDRRVQVRALQLECDELAQNRQLALFSAEPDRTASPLQAALDQLRNRYGRQIVQRGRSLLPATSALALSGGTLLAGVFRG